MGEACLGDKVDAFEDVPVRLLPEGRQDDEDVGEEEGGGEVVLDSDVGSELDLAVLVVRGSSLYERGDEVEEIRVDDGGFETDEDVEIPGDGCDERDDGTGLLSLSRRRIHLPELLAWIRAKVCLDEPEVLDANPRRPHLPRLELLRELNEQAPDRLSLVRVAHRRTGPDGNRRAEEGDGKEVHGLVSREPVRVEPLLERLSDVAGGHNADVKLTDLNGVEDSCSEREELGTVAFVEELIENFLVPRRIARRRLEGRDSSEAGEEGGEEEFGGVGGVEDVWVSGSVA